MAEASLEQKKKAGFKIRLEPRLEESPAWFPAFVSLLAIIVALILGGVVILLVGGDPIKSYQHIAKASFGDIGVISDTIVKATPILLTALACSVAFRMKFGYPCWRRESRARPGAQIHGPPYHAAGQRTCPHH